MLPLDLGMAGPPPPTALPLPQRGGLHMLQSGQQAQPLMPLFEPSLTALATQTPDASKGLSPLFAPTPVAAPSERATLFPRASSDTSMSRTGLRLYPRQQHGQQPQQPHPHHHQQQQSAGTLMWPPDHSASQRATPPSCQSITPRYSADSPEFIPQARRSLDLPRRQQQDDTSLTSPRSTKAADERPQHQQEHEEQQQQHPVSLLEEPPESERLPPEMWGHDSQYRSKPCAYYFHTGHCQKGDRCNFSHELLPGVEIPPLPTNSSSHVPISVGSTPPMVAYGHRGAGLHARPPVVPPPQSQKSSGSSSGGGGGSSSPGHGSAAQVYRSKPCRFFFEKHQCLKGDRCNFSHDPSSLPMGAQPVPTPCGAGVSASAPVVLNRGRRAATAQQQQQQQQMLAQRGAFVPTRAVPPLALHGAQPLPLTYFGSPR